MYRKLIAVFSLSFLIWGVASEPLHAKIKIELLSGNNARALSQSEAVQLNRNDFNDDPGYVAAVKNAQEGTAITPKYTQGAISIGQILYIWRKIINQDRHLIGHENPLVDPTKFLLAQKIAQYMYLTHDPENSGVVLNNDKTLSVVDPRKYKKRTAEIIRDALFYRYQNSTRYTIESAKIDFVYEFNKLIQNIEYYWLSINPELVNGYDNFQEKTGIAPPQFSVVYENGQNLLKYTIPQEQANNQVIILSALPEEQRPSNYLTELVKFFQGESEANVLTKINNLTGVNTLTLPGLFLPDSAKKVAEEVAKLGFKVFWGVSEIHAGDPDHIINAVPSQNTRQPYKVIFKSALPEAQRIPLDKVNPSTWGADEQGIAQAFINQALSELNKGHEYITPPDYDSQGAAKVAAEKFASLGFRMWYGQIGSAGGSIGSFVEATSYQPQNLQQVLSITNVLPDGNYKDTATLADELEREGLITDEAILTAVRNLDPNSIRSSGIQTTLYLSDGADYQGIANKFSESGYNVVLAQRAGEQDVAGSAQEFPAKSPQTPAPKYKLTVTGSLDEGQVKDEDALKSELKSAGVSTANYNYEFNDIEKAKKVAGILANSGYAVTLAEYENGSTKPGTEQFFEPKSINATDFTKYDKARLIANIDVNLPGKDQATPYKNQVAALPNSFKDVLDARKIINFIKKYEVEAKGSPTTTASFQEVNQGLKTQGLVDIVKRIQAAHPGEDVLKWLNNVEEIKSFDDLTPKEIIMANLKYHILHENQEEIEKFKALPDSFDSLDNAKKWVAYIKRFEREIKGNPSDIVALDSLRISGLRQLIKRIIDKYPEENVLGWLESDTVPVASSVSNLLEGLNFAELEERAAYTANTQLLKDAVMAKATENPDLGIKALTQGVNLDTPQENPVAVKDIAEKLQKIAVDQREGVKGLGDGLETTAEALEKKQNASFGWLISSSIKQDEEEAAKDCVERLLQKPKLKAVLQKPRDNYATVMVTRGDSIYEKGSNEPLMTLKKHYCGMALGTLVE